MDGIEPISIHLATGSKDVSDLMSTVPIVFGDAGRHAITQHFTCWIIKTNLMILFKVCISYKISIQILIGWLFLWN